ncbi:hypothetical protein SPRG_18239, partial [Saprolegnia parasitica CBS 223.65]
SGGRPRKIACGWSTTWSSSRRSMRSSSATSSAKGSRSRRPRPSSGSRRSRSCRPSCRWYMARLAGALTYRPLARAQEAVRVQPVPHSQRTAGTYRHGSMDATCVGHPVRPQVRLGAAVQPLEAVLYEGPNEPRHLGCLRSRLR